MPRSFDSDDDPRELVFTENVECPYCAEIFLGEFKDLDESLSVQDMVNPPLGEHECPECGTEFITVMTGWMLYGEAG